MRLFVIVIAILASAVCRPAHAGKIEEAENEVAAENAEMADMFSADQAIRLEVEKRGGWRAVEDDPAFMQRWEREDRERMKRTSELLELNALKAGIDFYRAAFIFQHGDRPEDFLRAHHLAVVSLSKGYDARWISAATLDRYLHAIGKQPIYGSQYQVNEAGEYIRQPTAAGVVSDAERALLNIPKLTDEK